MPFGPLHEAFHNCNFCYERRIRITIEESIFGCSRGLWTSKGFLRKEEVEEQISNLD
jgi:hypothetical protein